MRFAYIDSQGNEVPIPSVDALALRIELGAVGPDTQLYDAQADHWGPASTHEIFHSLSRASGEEGFMAPPPPVAPAPPAAGRPKAPKPKPAPEPEPKEEEEEDGGGAFDLGLTLAAPQPEGPRKSRDRDDRALGDITAAARPKPSQGDPDPLAGAFLDLEPAAPTPTPTPTPEPEPEPEPVESGGGFDFGDLGSGLELESAPVEQEEPSMSGVEPAMEFGSPPASFDADDNDLMLEQPMSAFEPDSPPGWMEEQSGDDVMDFSAAGTEDDVEDAVAPVADASARQRRTPKDRPSKPKFKSQRSMSGPIFVVVLLVALGVGGYYGWPFLQQYLESRNAPERPPVAMPDIPAELMPRMQSVANAAIAGVVSAADRATRSDAPQEPDEEWLSGVYLSNASQYPGVGTFWESIDSFLAGLRDVEWQGYHDAFVARLDAEGLDAQAAAQVTERADSGFVAAQPQRMAALGELERAATASLRLHDFLLQNEADISVHQPGAPVESTLAIDPVLEIVAPQADIDQMAEMLDEITDALDALGSLDRVTRERLVGAMTARIQQVGIQ